LLPLDLFDALRRENGHARTVPEMPDASLEIPLNRSQEFLKFL
jgi:hypothetical protein